MQVLVLSLILLFNSPVSQAKSARSSKYHTYIKTFDADEESDDSVEVDGDESCEEEPQRRVERDGEDDTPTRRRDQRPERRPEQRPNRRAAPREEPRRSREADRRGRPSQRENGEDSGRPGTIRLEPTDSDRQIATQPAPQPRPQPRQQPAPQPRPQPIRQQPAEPASTVAADDPSVDLDLGDEAEQISPGARQTGVTIVECDSPVSQPPLQPIDIAPRPQPQPNPSRPAPAPRPQPREPRQPASPAPAPQPHPEQPRVQGGHQAYVKSLAGSSSCARYNWRGRGRAPLGYTKGVALSFARSLCRIKAPRSIISGSTLTGLVDPARLIAAPAGSRRGNDVLTHYGSTLAALGINAKSDPADAVRASYVIGYGLGMRESSGRWCEGADASARSGRGAQSIEAGAFQTSFDSMANPELKALFAAYKTASPEKCQLNVWQEGVRCSVRNVGSGEAAKFQQLSKTCPAFAAEYAIAVTRTLRNHYGPLNRREAEATPACNNLLKEVQGYIEADTSRCTDFL